MFAQVNQGLGSPLSRGQLAALAAHASRHGEVEPGTRRREAMIDYELFLDSFSSASPLLGLKLSAFAHASELGGVCVLSAVVDAEEDQERAAAAAPVYDTPSRRRRGARRPAAAGTPGID